MQVKQWVQRYRGGNQSGRRELQRSSISIHRLQSVMMTEVGKEGDAYQEVWFVSYRLSGDLMHRSLFLLLVRGAASPSSRRFSVQDVKGLSLLLPHLKGSSSNR